MFLKIVKSNKNVSVYLKPGPHHLWCGEAKLFFCKDQIPGCAHPKVPTLFTTELNKELSWKHMVAQTKQILVQGLSLGLSA